MALTDRAAISRDADPARRRAGEGGYLDGELCGADDNGVPSFAPTQAVMDGERGAGDFLRKPNCLGGASVPGRLHHRCDVEGPLPPSEDTACVRGPLDFSGSMPSLRSNGSWLGRTFGLDDSGGTINVNVGDTLHETSLLVIQARRLDVTYYDSNPP
jgi:hypothetical protein